VIANIIDKRSRPYRWKRVRAIAEATYHDNSVADADRAAAESEAVDYAELDDMALSEAIAWAQAQPGDITLFIYDAPEVEAPQKS